jgi:hypothetical protein
MRKEEFYSYGLYYKFLLLHLLQLYYKQELVVRQEKTKVTIV